MPNYVKNIFHKDILPVHIPREEASAQLLAFEKVYEVRPIKMLRATIIIGLDQLKSIVNRKLTHSSTISLNHMMEGFSKIIQLSDEIKL